MLQKIGAYRITAAGATAFHHVFSHRWSTWWVKGLSDRGGKGFTTYLSLSEDECCLKLRISCLAVTNICHLLADGLETTAWGGHYNTALRRSEPSLWHVVCCITLPWVTDVLWILMRKDIRTSAGVMLNRMCRCQWIPNTPAAARVRRNTFF